VHSCGVLSLFTMKPTDPEITKKIIHTRNAIRKKFRELKDTKHRLGVQSDEQFKTVTAPLKELIQHVKEEKTGFVPYEKLDPKFDQTTTTDLKFGTTPFIKNKFHRFPTANSTPGEIPASTMAYDQETDFDNSSVQLNESVDGFENATGPEEVFEMEPSPQLKRLQRGYTTVFKEKMGDVAGEYIKQLFSTETPQLDTVYGFKSLEQEGLALGNKKVQIANNDLIIDNKEYEGTPGLYELLIRKFPSREIYTQADLDNYKLILEQTKVHKRIDGTLKGGQSYKYKNIIRPMFITAVKHPNRIDKTGGGYKFWNTANELVDRLRLLTASQEAGNNIHRNEIISIIEELREERIIL